MPDERPFVAVAVSLSRRHNQWHAGLAYGDAEDPVARFLHLATDLALLDQPLDDESLGWDQRFVWMEVQAPLATRRALVQLCRTIAERVRRHGQEVRYAVRHHLGRFDSKSGAHVPADGERGLTCATTVLATCRGVGLELVDVTTWPPRDEDAAWIKSIVEHLKKKDPVWAKAVEADGLCPRFRPHEVAGAALSPYPKVPFDGALSCADLVVRRYDEVFPPVVE